MLIENPCEGAAGVLGHFVNTGESEGERKTPQHFLGGGPKVSRFVADVQIVALNIERIAQSELLFDQVGLQIDLHVLRFIISNLQLVFFNFIGVVSEPSTQMKFFLNLKVCSDGYLSLVCCPLFVVRMNLKSDTAGVCLLVQIL